jgi:hypothetical protein
MLLRRWLLMASRPWALPSGGPAFCWHTRSKPARTPGCRALIFLARQNRRHLDHCPAHGRRELDTLLVAIQADSDAIGFDQGIRHMLNGRHQQNLIEAPHSAPRADFDGDACVRSLFWNDLRFMSSINVLGLPSRGRHTALVVSIALRPGDPLALALQHDFSFCLTDSADDRQHQATGRRAGEEIASSANAIPSHPGCTAITRLLRDRQLGRSPTEPALQWRSPRGVRQPSRAFLLNWST